MFVKSFLATIGLNPLKISLKFFLKNLGSISASSLNSTKASSSTVSSSY